jgi:hypothetical protein
VINKAGAELCEWIQLIQRDSSFNPCLGQKPYEPEDIQALTLNENQVKMKGGNKKI